MANKLEIPSRNKNEQKCTTVRLKSETMAALDKLATESNRSRNEIIAMMLEHCIEHAVVIKRK